MKTVLVTGGAGYIGSHACKALKLAGYLPVCYDNLVYGHRWAVKWGPFEKGDILDRKNLDRVMRKYKPKAIMHFAAYAYVGESVLNPSKYYRNNVAGTLTLLEAMKDHGVNHFIFSSSCTTYGIPKMLPISEDHPKFPISPYGFSKLMVEQILRDFSSAYDMRYVSLRYFNAAGADPDVETGECHDPETHLIPLILDVALGRKKHIDIFGTDYSTPDGTCIRDYIHVTDLANAHLKSLEYLNHGGKSDFFNLGNGKGFSVKNVIDTAEKVSGKNISTRNAERRPGDPPELVGSSQKAQQILGWELQYADLEVIVKTAFEWHKRLPI